MFIENLRKLIVRGVPHARLLPECFIPANIIVDGQRFVDLVEACRSLLIEHQESSCCGIERGENGQMKNRLVPIRPSGAATWRKFIIF